MKYVDLNGIRIGIVRKRIKNLYVRVDGKGEVTASAPLFMTDGEIRRFIVSKEEWIRKAIEKRRGKSEVCRDVTEGEERTLLGKRYILRFDREKNGDFYFEKGGVVLCVKEESTPAEIRKKLADAYRKVLSGILPEMIADCEKISDISAREWKIRDMKTRWGSCTPKERRIRLSVWLAEKPVECIRMVVFHELTHIRIKGHNAQFYDLLGKYCPSYKEYADMLKK